MKRDFSSKVNSQVQARQSLINDTMEVFNECVDVVQSEVATRKLLQ